MNNSENLVEFRNILNENKIYIPEQIGEVLKYVRPNFRFSACNTKVKYFNVPASLDIETTSFFRSTGNAEDEKCAIMYIWTFGIYGAIIQGRTWEEYRTMINYIAKELKLNENKRLLVYCHNLGYEFEFMRKWFNWQKVFAMDNHKPLYALTVAGIEYRCSLLLSGYSLEVLANNLHTYDIKKLVGDLDYSLIRHSKTPLSPEEIAYCVNDVKIVMAYIAECIDESGGIAYIPLTKTGRVRNYCRNSCFFTPGKPRKEDYKRLRYLEMISRLRLSEDEYHQLKRAFQGGFTHANPYGYGRVFENVTSYDFTSSYPTVMIAEQFPMGSSERVEHITPEEFYKSLDLYCCVFDIEINNLQPLIRSDNYISASRCYQLDKPYLINNGRVVFAKRLCTTMTNVDFIICKKFYTWGDNDIQISNFRRYPKGYLPTDFVKAILKLYKDKTELKGVSGKEVEYLNSKEMLNSCYGMCVTDICREEFIYQDNHWLEKEEKPPINYELNIKKYNNNRGRFLFYAWGVFITAYARRNLFSGIMEFGADYIYSDTDSIKVMNEEKHRDYIEWYNKTIREQLYDAMDYHKLPYELIEPLTKDGIKKCLGVWDFDGHYSRFKTLGAKRYMVQYSHDPRNKSKDFDKVQITVAGLNKQKCMPYLCTGWAYSLDGKQEYNSPFDAFTEDLYIPPQYTGKNVHTYINAEREGYITDYLGTTAHYRELSGIHLGQSEYSLKLSKEYSDFLLSIKDKTIFD